MLITAGGDTIRCDTTNIELAAIDAMRDVPIRRAIFIARY